jgi:hypothetical protein
MNKNLFLIALVSMLASCQQSQNKEIFNEKNNPVKVTTKTIELVKDYSELHYSGTIEPSQSVALCSRLWAPWRMYLLRKAIL